MHRPFREEFSDLRPAPFGKRLLAIVYDTLVLVAIWMIVSAIAVGLNHGEGIDSGVGNALLRSALFCCSFLFFAYFWTRNGQTLGMQAWRLRVQTFDGQRLSWTQALIRFLASILSWIPLGLGYIWMLFSDEKLTWHDRLSESCVVVLPKKPR